MDYLELLYADRVRTLALDMQSIARNAAEKAAGERWEDQVDHWEFDNPLVAFIEDVHEELVAIGRHVRQL